MSFVPPNTTFTFDGELGNPGGFIRADRHEQDLLNDQKVYVGRFQHILSEMRSENYDATTVNSRAYKITSTDLTGITIGNIHQIPSDVVPGTLNKTTNTAGDPGGLLCASYGRDCEVFFRYRPITAIVGNGTLTYAGPWTSVSNVHGGGGYSWLYTPLPFPVGTTTDDLYQIEVWASSPLAGFLAGYYVTELELQSADP